MSVKLVWPEAKIIVGRDYENAGGLAPTIVSVCGPYVMMGKTVVSSRPPNM